MFEFYYEMSCSSLGIASCVTHLYVLNFYELHLTILVSRKPSTHGSQVRAYNFFKMYTIDYLLSQRTNAPVAIMFTNANGIKPFQPRFIS
jgi:hypothetical protein